MYKQRITSVAKVFLPVLAGIVFSCMPFAAAAHVTGSSWEVPAGNYTADVGYDPIAFSAGSYTRFDFNLKKGPGTTDPVDFTEVWVRIKDANSNQNTYLATGIRKEPIGPTTLLYLFSLPGNYSLEASFRDADGNEIAAASFPITVGASLDTPFLYGFTLDALLVFAGVVLGAVSVSLFSIIRKARRS